MQSLKASVFKATCLKVMDEVQRTGTPVVITKNGKPISKLVPYVDKPKSLMGLMADSVHIHDDLLSPLDVSWEADT